MIVVDSAVWVAWFNGRADPHVSRLDRGRARKEDFATAPLIITEVLQGFADDREFERARDFMIRLPSLALDENGHVEAARLYRTLRKRGLTIRGTVDCIIAQTCISNACELLSPDRDFAAIAKHSALKLCAV